MVVGVALAAVVVKPRIRCVDVAVSRSGDVCF